jgi:chaperonin cofactor prefoldin
MSTKYIKNSSGKGLVLRDTRAIAELREKTELQNRLSVMEQQLDKLQERIARLESTPKD